MCLTTVGFIEYFPETTQLHCLEKLRYILVRYSAIRDDSARQYKGDIFR